MTGQKNTTREYISVSAQSGVTLLACGKNTALTQKQSPDSTRQWPTRPWEDRCSLISGKPPSGNQPADASKYTQWALFFSIPATGTPNGQTGRSPPAPSFKCSFFVLPDVEPELVAGLPVPGFDHPAAFHLGHNGSLGHSQDNGLPGQGRILGNCRYGHGSSGRNQLLRSFPPPLVLRKNPLGFCAPDHTMGSGTPSLPFCRVTYQFEIRSGVSSFLPNFLHRKNSLRP